MKTQVPRDMQVSNPWAEEIFAGHKKVEVRKDDPYNWGSVKSGDVLNIIATQNGKPTGKSQLFTVVQTRTYYSLDECVITEGVRNLLPGLRTLEDARSVYLGFDGADAASIKRRQEEYEKFGCIAIELQPYAPEKVPSQEQTGEHEKSIMTHVMGSSRPKGDPQCWHANANGQSTIQYNQETMGGCGSGWDRMCEQCGKVWYDV